MRSIADTFRALREKGDGALIGYVMAGDPSLKETFRIVESLVQGGVDVLELGIPFSDPIADGPTIQAAGLRALKAGTTPLAVLEVGKEVASCFGLPVVLLTYFNPVFRAGLGSFLRLAKQSGVAGLIVPDLPVEEASEYKSAALREGLDTIFLAAPSTTAARLERIVRNTSGFLYLVSVFGVTGIREKIQGLTLETIRRVLPYTRGRLPLGVGFGVSQPSHVEAVLDAGADAAVVGSAFVRMIEENLGNPEMLQAVERKARELKSATVGRLQT
ncbi:MAG: tryptophan synthase subunit alpha [Candidatus Bathyarchaeia archaeon]